MMLLIAIIAAVMRSIALMLVISVALLPVRPFATTGLHDHLHSSTVANETNCGSKYLRAEHCENAKHENKTHEW